MVCVCFISCHYYLTTIGLKLTRVKFVKVLYNRTIVKVTKEWWTYNEIHDRYTFFASCNVFVVIHWKPALVICSNNYRHYKPLPILQKMMKNVFTTYNCYKDKNTPVISFTYIKPISPTIFHHDMVLETFTSGNVKSKPLDCYFASSSMIVIQIKSRWSYKNWIPLDYKKWTT